MSVIAGTRVLLSLARPAVVFLLALFAATGLAVGGAADRPALAALVMVTVLGFLLFAVVVNDLADEAIDRVNLPDGGRPLVDGRADRVQLVVVAAAAALVAAGGSVLVGGPAPAVTTGGMLVAAAYSLPPVRLAGRGAVASLVLPAGYVAVPYLLGLTAAGAPLAGRNAVLLAGLYLGFVGRILLKDFRDVRGDALFGKRTFLVRHGRAATCRFSAACWLVGSGALLGVRGVTPVLLASHLALTGMALVLLRRLRVDRGPRSDETLVSAIAVVGRGLVTILVVHLSMLDAPAAAARTPLAVGAMTAALTALVLGQVHALLRHGPRTRTTVPAAWSPAPHALPPPVLGPRAGGH